MNNQSFRPFAISSSYQPAGDQPEAITALHQGFRSDLENQVLLGVTGSGKTFTMAHVIEQLQKPTLIIAHNKTLAAQLYQEFRDFFPHNAVSYFVSYYDYYQPEAYIPSTDTYIEKESQVNDEIDKLRLATTANLLTRPDVIVVASVSCIYNLGSPVEYGQYILELIEGELIPRDALFTQLTNLQYDRSDAELRRGTYRIRGDIIQLWPAYTEIALRIDTLENRIVSIDPIDPVSGGTLSGEAISGKRYEEGWFSGQKGSRRFVIYPAKHYVVNPKTQADAIAEIERDLALRVAELKAENKLVEAYRLNQKVQYDLENIREFGFTNGIENYSRYFDGRKPGEPPFSLLEYFAENVKRFGHLQNSTSKPGFLTIVDESHITLPQVRGMHHGDRSRKDTLVKYGFRLPSAIDNRPLQFHEFLQKTNQRLFVSATPNEWEINSAEGHVVEQVVRPTGLLDPEIEIRPSERQLENLVWEIIRRKQIGERVLVTTLTKRMAESLTEYLNDEVKLRKLLTAYADQFGEAYLDDNGQPFAVSAILKSLPALPKVAYLHSDVETLERSDILDDLRRGEYDVLVGINLLREGLDLPEVSLVAILDADKEGFLRSATSLIQTMGRAARHVHGRVILYADRVTKSMQFAIDETTRRRSKQIEFNQQHQLTPTGIQKPIRERMLEKQEEDTEAHITAAGQAPQYINLSKTERIDLRAIKSEELTPADRTKLAAKLRRRMHVAANDLDFELAATLRDSAAKLLTAIDE